MNERSKGSVTRVIDASALLAFLHDEKGSEKAQSLLPNSTISAVNYSEVIQKLLFHKIETEDLRDNLSLLGISISPFTVEQAEIAAKLWNQTKENNLSLADRACLSLARQMKVPAVTADRAWEKLKTGISIEVIR